MTTKLMEQNARIAQAQTEIIINAPREKVFAAWFEHTADWFYHSEETKSSHPTICEKRIGGRFYTALPDEGFNVLGELTMIKPNNKIRIRGDCTMPLAVLMNITVSFEDTDEGTRVNIDHRMSGEVSEGMAEEFEAGWLDGLEKLKGLLEA